MKYKAHTVINLAAIEPSQLAECDCVIYLTNSRGLTSEVAYDKVYEACAALATEGTILYSHRIDSTLREILEVRRTLC